VEIRLLGPVQVVAGGVTWPVGPPQRQCLLAVLAAQVGRQLTTDALVDRVWDDDPPAAARRAVHAHIARLRHTLAESGPGTSGALVSRSGGYLLDIDPHRVDLHRFRYLVGRARSRQDDPVGLRAVLDEALRLWRGDPLAGLHGSWVDGTRAAWRRERVDAMVAWANAELQAAGPDRVIVDATAALAEDPLCEPLAAVLVRALHAGGHAAEALECYAGIRARLAEDFGTDPGPELREAHLAILRGTPTHDLRFRARSAAAVPAQLPPDIRGFSGRLDHLRRLDALLTDRSPQPSTVGISALSGTAGVGKTALAVYWAHRVADRFPDGQLYINLRGFDPEGQAVAPENAIRIFLVALGFPADRMPSDLDAQIGLYRSVISGKRLLIVLDNARDANQVRPLLPGTPTAAVVVTSRNQLTGLVAVDGARPINVGVLPDGEAWQLLEARLGRSRLLDEADSARQILRACAGLPLALTIAAARAQVSSFPLSSLANELSDLGSRLDVLDNGEPSSQVRTVFSWSYRALTARAARLFRLLSLCPGPDFSAFAAANLLGVGLPDGQALLAELVRANLTTERLPGRYSIHDLLRLYATDLSRRLDTDERRRNATRRLLDCYLHSGHAANRLINPARDPIVVGSPVAGVTVEQHNDYRRATEWFEIEHPTLVAAVGRAFEASFDKHAWQLAWVMTDYLDWRGFWHDWVTCQHVAVAATARLADIEQQSRAHRMLGLAHLKIGRLADADADLRRALDLSTQIGDRTGRAHCHNYLMEVDIRRRHYPEALTHGQQSLDLYTATGRRNGRASALLGIGQCHSLLDHHARAIAACRRALVLLDPGHRPGQAAASRVMGFAHHHLGQYSEALTHYELALKISRDIGDRYLEADTLSYLGETLIATGEIDAARRVWQLALAILSELEHDDAQALQRRFASITTAPPPAR
jgi:DNA-binding SARP family transcriptional activator/tetratricopeptide (TPR) repeat protein